MSNYAAVDAIFDAQIAYEILKGGFGTREIGPHEPLYRDGFRYTHVLELKALEAGSAFWELYITDKEEVKDATRIFHYLFEVFAPARACLGFSVPLNENYKTN